MMTARDLALIDILIYYNPPKEMLRRVGCCLTAGMMAKGILDDPPDCEEIDIEALKLILKNREVSESRIERYINHNDTNGFVAFALRSPHGESVLAFRGSESGECAPSGIDWIDNVVSPFASSIQYADVERFVNFNPGEAALCTGHSKGGHNAMYAVCVSKNARNTAVCFDAQGFSSGQLTSKQKSRLRLNAVNYVYRRDLVGALLCHPEKRIFVKGTHDVNAHSLYAIAFDLSGDPIASRQALIPKLIGRATCALPLPFGSDTGAAAAE